MNLIKHRNKLIAARDEMSRIIAAIDTVLGYTATRKPKVAVTASGKRIGRPPKNAIRKGDEKTGVKKSTLTKPFKPKKVKKKGKRLMSPEGEARRRAGYFAYQERMRKEREAKTEAQGRYRGMRGTPRKPVQSAARKEL